MDGPPGRGTIRPTSWTGALNPPSVAPPASDLEAASGIEPLCRDLQSLASTTRPRRRD